MNTDRSSPPLGAVRRVVFAVLLAAALGGCTGMQRAPEPCRSLHCLATAQFQNARRTCMKDLFTYERYRSRQDSIDARYGYPFVSTSNYQEWVRVGGTGPSPQEWCRDYASQQIQPQAFVGR